MFPLIALVALLALSGSSDAPQRASQRAPVDKRPEAEGAAEGADAPTADELPPLPDWLPDGVSLSRAPPPNAPAPEEHPLVRAGAWYWTDLRTLQGDNYRGWPTIPKPVWHRLTRIHAPPESAKLLLLRVWIRGETSNGKTGRDRRIFDVGVQIDITANLDVPLVAAIEHELARPLVPGMALAPVRVRLTRNADGSIDVDASKNGQVAINNVAMALEFAFRA